MAGMDFYNNTIANSLLMPTTDSLAKEEALAYDSKALNSTSDTQTKTLSFENHARTVNLEKTVKTNNYLVHVQYDKSMTQLSNLQSVTGLSVTRAVEARPIGGFSRYLVKLPGPLQYGPVTFGRFQFTNDTFYRWLINGIDEGGIRTADFHIWIGVTDVAEHGCIQFTLKDAFPISWSMGDMTGPDANGDYLKVVESMTIVYGKLEVG